MMCNRDLSGISFCSNFIQLIKKNNIKNQQKTNEYLVIDRYCMQKEKKKKKRDPWKKSDTDLATKAKNSPLSKFSKFTDHLKNFV